MKQFCARYTGMQFAVICVNSIQTFSNEFAGDHNNTHTSQWQPWDEGKMPKICTTMLCSKQSEFYPPYTITDFLPFGEFCNDSVASREDDYFGPIILDTPIVLFQKNEAELYVSCSCKGCLWVRPSSPTIRMQCIVGLYTHGQQTSRNSQCCQRHSQCCQGITHTTACRHTL